MIDPEVQLIVDSNSPDISAEFPSFIDRAFKEDEEYLNHPSFRVFTHFTNLKMLCLRSAPTEIESVTFLVQQHPKNKKYLVKENEPLVKINSEIFTAPFEAEIVAFNHRDVRSHLLFANRKFPKKRKLVDL